jgi:hypothetical protein
MLYYKNYKLVSLKVFARAPTHDSFFLHKVRSIKDGAAQNPLQQVFVKMMKSVVYLALNCPYYLITNYAGNTAGLHLLPH